LHVLDHDLAVAEDEGVDDPIQIAGDQHLGVVAGTLCRGEASAA
jgi:hypothetical protein